MNEDASPRTQVDNSGSGEPKHWIEYAILLFVVVSAIATGTAAYYARQQWFTATDTEQRQLRAYVFPTSANAINVNSSQPAEGNIGLKNSGQTPAYRLSARTVISVREFPLQSPLPDPQSSYATSVLGPGAGYTLSAHNRRPLTSSEIQAIQGGTKAIYVYGDVTYTDAFGSCWVSKFRLFYGGNLSDSPNGEMHYDEQGNEETECPHGTGSAP
jgi:hypothetical protein